MKKRYTLPALLMLVILCAACTKQTQSEGQLALYFPFADTAGHGFGYGSEVFQGDAQPPPAKTLLLALLRGPADDSLKNPFPADVEILECALDPQTQGLLHVRLSEQYGGLADVDLTLADYSIVLTLSQLEQVETVEILSAGDGAEHRNHSILSKDEVLYVGESERAHANK